MSQPSDKQETNLIVNYLPPNFRESDLQELFSRCGHIVKVKVVCRKDTAESMTYGFVKFQSPKDAATALRDMSGREVGGKKIKVSYARRGLDASNSKIFVKRLPPSYTFVDVHRLFLQFGEIIETRLLMDDEGNSRQIAFIQYSSRQEADAAIANMSDIIPPNGTQPLIVRHALQPKGHHDPPTNISPRKRDEIYTNDIYEDQPAPMTNLSTLSTSLTTPTSISTNNNNNSTNNNNINMNTNINNINIINNNNNNNNIINNNNNSQYNSQQISLPSAAVPAPLPGSSSITSHPINPSLSPISPISHPQIHTFPQSQIPIQMQLQTQSQGQGQGQLQKQSQSQQQSLTQSQIPGQIQIQSQSQGVATSSVASLSPYAPPPSTTSHPSRGPPPPPPSQQPQLSQPPPPPSLPSSSSSSSSIMLPSHVHSSHSPPAPTYVLGMAKAPSLITSSTQTAVVDPTHQSTHYLVYVTIDNVPPSFDLMSFIFLTNYGQVIEGKAETQDLQIIHSDGLPYLYRTYTGVYSFTLLVDKDRDITSLMGLNMAMVGIEGHLLQVKVSVPIHGFIHFTPPPPLDPSNPFV